jgi:hypothetical protein
MMSAGSPSKAAFALSGATGVVSIVAGLWTFLDPGLLHGPAAMNGSARGTALVLLGLAMPVLAVSIWLARTGSSTAVVTWGAALLYVVYNSILFLFLTPFNAAFLLYVAMLGLALWSVGTLLASVGFEGLGSRFSPTAPVRAVAVYVWVVVVLNALAWLAAIVPGLSDPEKYLEGTGVATNAIHVQDLAFWLPLMGVAAYWLYRRQARGLVVCSAVLGMWVIESVSIAVDQWMGANADPNSSVVSSALVGPFAALAVIGAVPVWLLIRHMRPQPMAEPVHTSLPAPAGQRSG